MTTKLITEELIFKGVKKKLMIFEIDLAAVLEQTREEKATVALFKKEEVRLLEWIAESQMILFKTFHEKVGNAAAIDLVGLDGMVHEIYDAYFYEALIFITDAFYASMPDSQILMALEDLASEKSEGAQETLRDILQTGFRNNW